MKLRLLVCLLLLTACGQATPAGKPAAGDRIYVVDRGQSLAGVDVATGKVAVQMPLAVPTPDWKRAYGVIGNRLHYLDMATATDLGGVELPGPYQLPMTTADGRPGGLSHNGHWLILTKGSSFLEIELPDGQVRHRIDLPGRWDFDGIDDSGLRLYLTHYLDDEGRNYNVSLFHLDSGQVEGPIVEKGSEEPSVMQGRRLSALTDRWGTWQYSVYSRPSGAFIHMLSLRDPFTWCLDLPGGGTLDQQAAWSLAVSPSGHTLFAVNPVLDKAVAYSITSESPTGPPSKQASGSWSGSGPSGTGAASMVRAGRVLVAEARGVHLLGLAASSDGREIYAVAGDRLLRLDAATGKLESSLALTIDPSAILGVRAV